ncbi:MAG TPA: chemotaxis-specific protein-glutamate methyltransferase CheB [Rhodospirillales bacterium]|nr:chemotaxis-specific protein-glutamate methyltransferase CheB [Rhodospirillales bacterium]
MRLLVVDDSALMRRCLRECFEGEADIEVRTARDGKDALEQVKSFDPDVITLDINMPVMDGLTCLSHIMEELPRPVVMVSSLTDTGALATFEALELGAVDYVTKPGGTVSLNLRAVFPDLISKVRQASEARSGHRPVSQRLRAQRLHAQAARPARQAMTVARAHGAVASADLVLIGVSTGGPRTIEDVLVELPKDFPAPILVAQHMPARFTSVFAARLNERCEISVQEVVAPTPLEAGRVYVARGDADVTLSLRLNRLTALSTPADPKFPWHPSVSRMVASAMAVVDPSRLIAVQLTGMGDDGANEITELRRQGGRTIAESEETAVIFGMPKEVISRGGATRVLPAHKVAQQLQGWIFEPPSRP